jgi:dihydroorotase
MSAILIKGGRVIDPACGLDRVADVLLRDGRVAAVGANLSASSGDAETVEAADCIVAPGLIDMHVHLREPGSEHQETIASGSRAAVAGGFATVCSMPNTDPCVDNEGAVAFIVRCGAQADQANVLPIGAMTVGRKGEQMAELGQMVRAGAVAFSDDGSSVADSGVLAKCMSYGRMFGTPYLCHAEDKSLSGGVMHGGAVSARLGLPGIPSAAEEIIVGRDIMLSRMTGGKLHIAHVSTAGSVELIRRAKAAGVQVTAEVTPHHLALTDEAVATYDPVFKMSPPLRTAADVSALKAGLKDGTIDCIASDHAPHEREAKELEFLYAPFGVIGLESALAVCIRELIESGLLSWPELIARMATNPARILGLQRGTLAEGAPADVTVIDPTLQWTIDANQFHSKSRNCPFHGQTVCGKAVMTIVGGKIKYRHG